MRISTANGFKLLLVLVLIVGFSACAKKQVPGQGGMGAGLGGGAGAYGPGGGGGSMGGGLDDARWRELGINSEAEKAEFLNKAQQFENQDIYFDYDSYILSEPAKRILEEKLAFLKRYPKVQVTIEGNCDQRGTTEYNLALGERRANSAQQFMVNSGISASQLTTISYGKERPIATGGDEASHAKNRRDHFALKY